MNDEIERKRRQLSEAQDALHQLNLGDKSVSVSHGAGRRTEWNQPDIVRLERYIQILKDEIRMLEGSFGRRPIYPQATPR